MLTRLRRIDALEQERAHPSLLLAELRALVREAEDWVRVEPGETDRAEEALDRCRDALDRDPRLETVSPRHRH